MCICICICIRIHLRICWHIQIHVNIINEGLLTLLQILNAQHSQCTKKKTESPPKLGPKMSVHVGWGVNPGQRQRKEIKLSSQTLILKRCIAWSMITLTRNESIEAYPNTSCLRCFSNPKKSPGPQNPGKARNWYPVFQFCGSCRPKRPPKPREGKQLVSYFPIVRLTPPRGAQHLKRFARFKVLH